MKNRKLFKNNNLQILFIWNMQINSQKNFIPLVYTNLQGIQSTLTIESL